MVQLSSVIMSSGSLSVVMTIGLGFSIEIVSKILAFKIGGKTFGARYQEWFRLMYSF